MTRGHARNGEPGVDAAVGTDGPVTVLHVDDEEGLLHLAETCLERESDRLTVETATNAANALDRLADGGVDCVVSDYDMPGMDGLELLRKVRAEYGDLPFVLYTGKGSEEIASEAVSAGVTDYLQKEGGTDQYAVLANRVENAVDRHRAERQVERGFRAMETAREGISMLDEDGRFEYVNPAYADLVGYDREELVGRHWELLYPDSEVDAVRETILSELPSSGRWTGQTVYERADGAHVLVDHAIAYADDGSMICLIRDLTEADGDGPLVAEDAVLAHLVDALDDVFYVLDPEGRIVRVNEPAVEITGYEESELTGMDATDLVAPDDREAVLADIEAAIETGSAVIEADLLTSDGREVPYEFRKRAVCGEEGELLGLVGIGRDVSERKRRERQLRRQAWQFEEFGSVLAHDLRNPLNVATGHLEQLRAGEESAVEVVAESLARLNDLIDDLSRVMREGAMVSSVEPVDLADVLDACRDSLGLTGLSVSAADAPVIRADREALERALENLLQNADRHGGDAVAVGRLPDGFYVEDDGPGIPPEDRERVFDPGYSTGDGGTGYGLVSVRQVALAHGWTVEATEGTDGGARFEFRDVQFADDPPRADPAATGRREASGSE